MSSRRPSSAALSLSSCFLCVPLIAACGAEGPGSDEAVQVGVSENALVGTLPSGLEANGANLAVTLVAPPRPVTTTDEQRHLVYELLLQNLGDTGQRPSALDVFEPGRRTPIASYSGETLQDLLSSLDPVTEAIGPGSIGRLFIDLAFDPGHRLPERLLQRIRTETASGENSVSGASVPVIRERPLVIAAPLRGGNLLACCRAEHGRALDLRSGTPFVSQRHAIDFLRTDGGESSFAGDPSDNHSYFIFGDDVLAVGAGRVVAVRDGMLDNDPTQPLPPLDTATAFGNYVVEDLGGGHFATYAHLENGSVRVQPGERVRDGQVLGLVGNTGNSDEPHLHFQVTDAADTWAANGLPYVFERFRLQGHIDVSGEQPILLPTPGPELRENRLPMDLDVIAFPAPLRAARH